MFRDLASWSYSALSAQEASDATQNWDDLKTWHESHEESDSIIVGPQVTIAPGLELRTPLLSWDETWKVLKQHVVTAADQDDDGAQQPSMALELNPTAPGCSRRVDREAISRSTNVGVLNAVTDADYTDAHRRVDLLKDGEVYIDANINKDVCFLLRLEHLEGEFAVGLGRRAFDTECDRPNEGLFVIKWYKRKNNRNSWGQQPAFKWTIAGFKTTARSSAFPLESLEPRSAFLPITVQLTEKCTYDEPVLSKSCMAAVRAYFADEETHNAEEDSEIVHAPPKRRRGVVLDDDEPFQE